MRFIRFHEVVHFLSPVDASSDGLYIYLALVSAALLGVGWQGRFSSHKVYTHLFLRMESSLWVFFLQGALSDTLDI